MSWLMGIPYSTVSSINTYRPTVYADGKAPGRTICCVKRACSTTYGTNAVKRFRQFTSAMSPTNQRAFCARRIAEAAPKGTGTRRTRTYFLDAESTATADLLSLNPSPSGNTQVCAKFFGFVVNKSANYLYQPTRPGKAMVELMSQARFHPTRKEDAVVLFMNELSGYYQMAPDSEFVFLPFPKRAFVHQVFQNQAAPENQVDHSYFMKVWRTNPICTRIKLRRHLRFALCDDCVDFREQELEQPTGKARADLKKSMVDHYDFVKLERQLYYIRRAKGVDPLVDAMSMIVDAADQRLYALPYFHVATHSSNKALRVPVHLMGVLVHGEAVHAHTYYENFKQGNNSTIEAIHSALVAKLARDGKLPGTLYLQLDNTSKQCKGRFLIGFLGYLVYKGLFKTIVLSFLPVGHTHEDIDQFFSRLSVYLKCHDAINMAQLHEAINRCYQSKAGHHATTGFWDRCTNFSDWIDPYLSKYKGISSHRQFRFYKDDDEVRVQARQHTSMKQEWAGITGNAPYTPVFKEDPPVSMVDVPPAQRRDLVAEDLCEKQKESVRRLCTDRRRDVADVADVLAGIDSLGDEADLPFTWDLASLLDSGGVMDPHVMSDDDGEVDEPDELPHEYEYKEGGMVLVFPDEDSGDPFWIAEVVSQGSVASGRNGEYEVWWYATSGDPYTGRYLKKYYHESPAVDWIYAQSIQHEVKVTGSSTLFVKSQKAIKGFVTRWAQADRDPDEFDENDLPAPVPDGMSMA